MIAYFILGLSLLAGFLLLARWFIATEPRQVIGLLRWTAAGAGLALAGYLLWGGRQALAALAVPMLIPLLLRWRAMWNRVKAAQGPRPGQSSSIRTRMLHMTLDHDTGDMEGIVSEGRYRGFSLDRMSLAELLDLLGECRTGDPRSAAVLEAYLDRRHGTEWREEAGPGPSGGEGPGSAPMTRDEAYDILGLDPGAAPEDIHRSHRRLMQKLHPDLGGSNYLAAKINEAKDLLLGS